MKKEHSLLFGAHMHIAGGLHRAIEQGEELNCSAMQIFTKSNRQWRAKAISDTEATSFIAQWKKSSIQLIIAHATYLINIGSPDKDIEKKSVDALTLDLERSALLNIPYLVMHPGTHSNTDENTCIERISNNIHDILKKHHTTSLLLENMAGQGSQVGYRFEHLAEIIKKSKVSRQLGVCFDTCHAFAAGYDFSTEKNYNAMWKEFDAIIGLNKLKAIHINDSKMPLGSRIDRHADIGKGKIGLTAFELLMNDPRFYDIPKILETPKKTPDEDAKNMATILELLSRKTRKILNCDK